MSNFEYIIASLPYLTADYRYEEGHGWEDVIGQIKENLSEKDTKQLDVLLSGFRSENLNQDFYIEVLSSPSKFIREYFRFDLNLRNAKVHYLNRALGRPTEEDVMVFHGENEDKVDTGEFEQAAKVEQALSRTSLLEREQDLDAITWEAVDSLETFHYFDLTAVLSYVAKLHIVDRWLALDPVKGQEFFRQLVKEVRGTFKGVQFNA